MAMDSAMEEYKKACRTLLLTYTDLPERTKVEIRDNVRDFVKTKFMEAGI